MEYQSPVLPEESFHCVQRVSAVGLLLVTPESEPLDVVVAQIHGVDVVDHVGSSKQHKPVDQPVTADGAVNRRG